MISKGIFMCLTVLLSAHLLQASGYDGDPEVVEYLSSLFNSVKDRTPRKISGLNLLPDEEMGFANIVRCFSNHYEVGQSTSTNTDLPPNQRRLTFDLSSVSSYEELVYIKLVYKVKSSYELDAMHSDNLQLNFYLEGANNQSPQVNLLTQFFSPSDTEWKGVPMFERWDGFMPPLRSDHMVSIRFELVSGQLQDSLKLFDAVLLQNIAVKLIVYTYDNVTTMGVGNDIDSDSFPHEQQTVSKRSVNEPTDSEFVPLSELASQTCQLQIRELNYTAIFGETLLILEPHSLTLNFTFCYGRCDQPFDLAEGHKYSLHAKLISTLNLHPNLPPPCCIPTERRMNKVIYKNLRDGSVTMTTLEDATTCGCR